MNDTLVTAPTKAGEAAGGDPGHLLACKRVKVADCPSRIPLKWIEDLEQNQNIRSCCRHPEAHDLEALFSSDADKQKGIPDIYIFHCPCGRQHKRFCVGGGPRIFWEIR